MENIKKNFNKLELKKLKLKKLKNWLSHFSKKDVFKKFVKDIKYN